MYILLPPKASDEELDDSNNSNSVWIDSRHKQTFIIFFILDHLFQGINKQ